MTLCRAALPGMLALALCIPVAARTPLVSRPMAVSAAHPLAVQAMLGLVEPQSSGLGGGAFLVRYDAASRRVTVYDGRETAPASAKATMFVDGDRTPIPRGKAMTSGQATGAPGVVAMLALAHSDHELDVSANSEG